MARRRLTRAWTVAAASAGSRSRTQRHGVPSSIFRVCRDFKTPASSARAASRFEASWALAAGINSHRRAAHMGQGGSSKTAPHLRHVIGSASASPRTAANNEGAMPSRPPQPSQGRGKRRDKTKRRPVTSSFTPPRVAS